MIPYLDVADATATTWGVLMILRYQAAERLAESGVVENREGGH